MPKVNVYLPEELAIAVKEAQLPTSAICQAALEKAVRDVTSARGSETPPADDRPWVGLFGRFTPRARQAVARAEQAARHIPHNYVGTEHVLLGVIDEGSNLGLKVLQSLDIEIEDLRGELTASMGPPTDEPQGDIPFTPLAKRVLELTAKESLALGHNYIGCEHIVLGLVADEDGMAGKVLRRMGVELRTTRRAVVTALSGYVHAQEPPPRATQSSTPTSSTTPADALADIRERLDAIERRLDS